MKIKTTYIIFTELKQTCRLERRTVKGSNPRYNEKVCMLSDQYKNYETIC